MSVRKGNDELTRASGVVDSIVHAVRCLSTVRLPGSLSPERLEVLRLIDAHAPVGVSDLARLAGNSPSSMSTMVRVLVMLGFVRKRGDKADRRASLVSLTARGRASLHQADRLLVRRMALALRQLPKEQAALLPRLVSKLQSLQEG